MSLLIGNDLVVSMHYTLTDNDGITIDSSAGEEPLTYLHGSGNIIPGLERELVGKSEGDKFEVQVAPEDGYGELQPELIQVVSKSVFEGSEEIEPGMAFHAQGADGALREIVVREVDGDEVTIDANHPLAGVELNFAIEVVTVREATAEELSHGHAH